jgi:hypothetical protein
LFVVKPNAETVGEQLPEQEIRLLFRERLSPFDLRVDVVTIGAAPAVFSIDGASDSSFWRTWYAIATICARLSPSTVKVRPFAENPIPKRLLLGSAGRMEAASNFVGGSASSRSAIVRRGDSPKSHILVTAYPRYVQPKKKGPAQLGKSCAGLY